MKNSITCNNCKEENSFYQLTCSKCSAFLRERIFNIDLFKVLGLQIESPAQSFRLIVFSEHKNFIFFILIFITAKILIDSLLLSLITLERYPVFGNFLFKYFIILLSLSGLIFLFSVLINYLNKFLGLFTRVKDNFSLITYSLIPHVYGLIILFPIELVVFGVYLFSKDPSPFLIKGTIAYIFLGFELLLILWSLFLTVSAMYVQSKNILYSIIVSFIFHLLFFFFIYLNSLYLY